MEEVDRSRAFVKDVKRLVIKVGTAVVTRNDGRIALGRLGALCEQLKELNSQGYEIILVSSGAVGLGRQRLRYRKLVNSSFADLQKPQVELDGKACAAVGQNCLMALYDTLFSQLDVSSAQLLVTDSDFRDRDFRKQLSETMKSLLSLKVIPIFNENDAVSTRRAPYEDSSGIFWDNDSLAALLALELKADLLILLSDVDGLYSGPPSDPRSKLIHTYIKEKHQTEITFGDKSRVGRGGMTAKVKAAVNAAYAGIPVVITSGFAAGNIFKVLQGQRIGTLFHQDAHLWAPVKEIDARGMAVAARESSRRLQAMTSEERKKILLDVADALETNVKLINIENEADVSEAQQAGYEKSLISRLALKPGKITSLAKSIRVLANMEDPIGRVLKKTELADGLVLEKTSSPLGVLLIVFESRPEALVQIASLAIRSGNGLLLKGGKEAKRSNAILHKIITEAIPESVGGKLIGLVTSREEIPDLLKHDDVIDLVIPRGSNKLVSQVKNSTKIPVLGHADGICHVYIDKSANMDMAKRIVLDAKIDYPAACNAMETLLVHNDLKSTTAFYDLVVELRIAGVTLYGGPRAGALLRIPEAHSFHHEYSSMACTVEFVDDVHAAIGHIHEHGSAHTDCIIAEDQEVVDAFLGQVDSAAIFHNASPRFCDGARFGLGAEVGISTSRIHARGPVGVEGLLTTRWILRGNGQIVDGDKGITYTHKDLPVEP
ncbi:delta-1-pyrroline-5-carboxylate synthase-like [Pyrus ussuriensis x Pyrus communis]|uniref:Delta-1-pyrroline-5-carboxylate synthase n=1 Tax=Pyrus ussuriensis x Pyrus communis TaxID=2448454 RepID=A0A5N5EZ63_9ROSA|nr:delta-1-pyrroline-5-carboxylate synthase-like [Pyrus ussuriensis x Pyrus communis]